jgi:hypothetical protein
LAVKAVDAVAATMVSEDVVTERRVPAALAAVAEVGVDNKPVTVTVITPPAVVAAVPVVMTIAVAETVMEAQVALFRPAPPRVMTLVQEVPPVGAQPRPVAETPAAVSVMVPPLVIEVVAVKVTVVEANVREV